jgi:hypothetical protein
VQALAEVEAPEVPDISPIDWMSCRPWLVARRAQLTAALFHEGAHLVPSDHGLRKARVDALRVFDQALAELDAERLG